MWLAYSLRKSDTRGRNYISLKKIALFQNDSWSFRGSQEACDRVEITAKRWFPLRGLTFTIMGTPDDKLGLTAEEDDPGVTISQDSEQGE